MGQKTGFECNASQPVQSAADARALAGKLGYLGGAAAETSVCQHYERRGLRCAARRWRASRGEIDLVLRDGDTIVFVEVKKSRSFASAAERLSRAQIRRIHEAASEFIAGEPAGQLSDVRFDLALVDATGQIEIRENAFGHF